MIAPIVGQLICGGAGLAVTLVAGHYGTKWFHDYLNRSAGLESVPPIKRVPPGITGTFERLLTFILVASHFPNPQNVVLAWLAAKLAANWQRNEPANSTDDLRREYRTRSLIAVMAGIVSVAFGYLGGVIGAP
jgi:hypothetical protein